MLLHSFFSTVQPQQLASTTLATGIATGMPACRIQGCHTLVHQSLSGNSASYLADDCRLVADARERRLRSTESRTMHHYPDP